MPDNPIETPEEKASNAQMFRRRALHYHAEPKPGKLEIRATKPLSNQTDLALAYSPGVAEACRAIHTDARAASQYTARGNLVAVVTNGTAALGLGDIGPLASKPIMEGKAVLFKKFANIDVFDIEIKEKDPEKLAEIIQALEPTFGAINLEDIKAPECFVVEELCRQKMSIPVFHDDQHGTAIVVAAAAVNAVQLVDKKMSAIKVVSTGGGAAGVACLNMFMKIGLKRENIWLFDVDGLIYNGRDAGMSREKAAFAQGTVSRTLDQVIEDADLFLGLSGPDVLKPSQVARMAANPIIFALANPTPEIMPAEARKIRPDALIATGRSDYPNQVNNVLCFPFVFRGALDAGASQINDAMQVACVDAIASLARAPVAAEAARVYRDETLVFGPEYLIPKPFDPRLLGVVAPAVAAAAAKSGVASRPIEDLAAYRHELDRFVYRSGMLMRPVFERARRSERRIVFAEGEDDRVLQAAYNLMSDSVSTPILVGRPSVIERKAAILGLPEGMLKAVDIVDPTDDPRYRQYWTHYHQRTMRDGVSPDVARAIIRTNTTAIAAVMVDRKEADALVCGTVGQFDWHLRYVTGVLGHAKRGDVALEATGAVSALVLDSGPVFFADTHVHNDPTAEQLVDIACSAARVVSLFGLPPKVAFVSRSSFGSSGTATAKKMRRAVHLMDKRDVSFQYEGEMNADAALDPTMRERIFPDSRLTGRANLLIAPDIESASLMKNAVRVLSGGLQVGPILMGFNDLAHIVTPSTTARGILNVAALAAAGFEGEKTTTG
jgi:malate dehydrogenase (oxaloacetate-decarboxylating)(NADP+)